MWKSAVLFFLVALCVVSIAAISDEIQEVLAALHNQCVEETGVSEDLIEKARKGDFADVENLKCFMKCVMEGAGMLNDDGTVNVEGSIARAPDEWRSSVAPMLIKCGTQVGANVCDSMWLTQKCYQAEKGDDYMLP